MKKRKIRADGSQLQDMASQDKLVRCEGNMWADLQPELLVNIFQRLPLKELLSVIPCVCKAWMRASLDPFCWQVLDLRELSTARASSYRLAHVLLRRTEGHLREFVFPFMAFHPDWLQVLKSSAHVLQKLHIPHSCVSDEWIITVAPLMTSLTDLDLSSVGSSQLSHMALEAIGKHCRRITHLRRNKQQYSRRYSSYLFNDDNEVFAIAKSYPALKHLELQYNCFSTQGVRAILDGCPMLEHLDLSACVMDMDEPLRRECQTRLRVFLGPRRLVEADEYDDDDDDDEDDEDDDDDDDDEAENVGCGCGGFPKMRTNCISELDHFCGLCDCPAYDCTVGSEYEGEDKDEEEEEDGYQDEDEDEDEDEDGDGVEDGNVDAYQGEGEDDCKDEDEIDGENEEEYVDDARGDVDVDEGEDNREDGFETGDESEEDYVDDDACGDAYIDEGEGICEDGFEISDENEEDYIDEDPCGDVYIDEGVDICEDGFEIGDENEENYVDDDDYASGDEDMCEDEYDENEEDYGGDDYVDDDYDQDGEDEVFFL